MNTIGYTKPLYILPFDHKTSFITKLFGWDYYNLTSEQKETIKETRMITYEGFEKAVAKGIPKEGAAILTDPQFGEEVLKKAKESGYITMVTTEKSGKEEFTFEYGDSFGAYIEKFAPTFTKALIRYNPQGDNALNKRQLETLKQLSDFSHEKGYKFLIEPLIPATETQLQSISNDKAAYDTQIRPGLTILMMRELQEAGIEPDVWKIEGFSQRQAYEDAVLQAQSNGRNDVGVVILGRGGEMAEVDEWIRVGSAVEGVIGFAVGRTVFLQPLEKLYKKEITKEEAIVQIAQNFYHFYSVFAKNKK